MTERINGSLSYDKGLTDRAVFALSLARGGTCSSDSLIDNYGVTGCRNLVGCIAITTLAAVGSVSRCSASRSYYNRDKVVNMIVGIGIVGGVIGIILAAIADAVGENVTRCRLVVGVVAMSASASKYGITILGAGGKLDIGAVAMTERVDDFLLNKDCLASRALLPLCKTILGAGRSNSCEYFFCVTVRLNCRLFC